MKLNKGFTLAEVLIALGIVGILAAISLPALQASASRKSIGPSVEKAFALLKNSNKLLLKAEESDNLEDACKDLGYNNDYLGCISRYSSMSKFPTANKVHKYYTYYNGTVQTSTFASLPVYGTNDGFIYAYEGGSRTSQPTTDFTAPKDANDTRLERFNGRYWVVVVDINGENKPNTMGKDVFRFLVDTSGVVFADGSRKWVDFYPGGKDKVWKVTCPSGKKPEAANARYCVGSIIDNGGRVLYK